MRHGQKHPNFSKLVVGLTVYKSLIRIPFFGRLVLLFGVFRLCMLVTYRRRTAAPCDSKRIARPRDLYCVEMRRIFPQKLGANCTRRETPFICAISRCSFCQIARGLLVLQGNSNKNVDLQKPGTLGYTLEDTIAGTSFALNAMCRVVPILCSLCCWRFVQECGANQRQSRETEWGKTGAYFGPADLIHSRAYLSNSARELKTKFPACSAFVCAPKKKNASCAGYTSFLMHHTGLLQCFGRGSCFQPNTLQTASKAKGTVKRATRPCNLFADAREIDVVSWLQQHSFLCTKTIN